MYHMKGLDKMESDMALKPEPRSYESLELVAGGLPQPVRTHSCIICQIVIDAKADEIVNIFTQAFPEEKNRVVQILTEIDPANETKYQKITYCYQVIIAVHASQTVQLRTMPL
ncbi:MAG: DUF4835 family protein [Marinilabiliales bacterium]|nr:DUF4835 family protein [Marinilabiliales bacterium]